MAGEVRSARSVSRINHLTVERIHVRNPATRLSRSVTAHCKKKKKHTATHIKKHPSQPNDFAEKSNNQKSIKDQNHYLENEIDNSVYLIKSLTKEKIKTIEKRVK